MSFETDARRAYALVDDIRRNNVEACHELMEILERYNRPVVRKTMKEIGIYYEPELEEDILIEGNIKLLAKLTEGFDVLNETFQPENMLKYCQGFYKNVALQLCGKYIRERQKVHSIQAMEEEGKQFENIKNQTADPAEKMIRREYMDLIRTIIHMYMMEFFHFRREPYMLLCLGYAKILSHILDNKKTDNAVGWAFQKMDDRNVRELSEEFRDLYNRSQEYQYIWGKEYMDNLKKPYKTRNNDIISIEDIIITEEFNGKEVSQWCIRINKSILKEVMKKILNDPSMVEHLMEYTAFRNAMKMVKNGKKGGGKKNDASRQEANRNDCRKGSERRTVDSVGT